MIRVKLIQAINNINNKRDSSKYFQYAALRSLRTCPGRAHTIH